MCLLPTIGAALPCQQQLSKNLVQHPVHCCRVLLLHIFATIILIANFMLTIWMSLHAHYMTQLQEQQSKESFDINAALSIGEVEKLTYLIRLLKNSTSCDENK